MGNNNNLMRLGKVDQQRSKRASCRTTYTSINLAGVIRILDLKGRLDERDDEIDDLHKKVRRLADRVHELETRADVTALMLPQAQLPQTASPVRRLGSGRMGGLDY